MELITGDGLTGGKQRSVEKSRPLRGWAVPRYAIWNIIDIVQRSAALAAMKKQPNARGHLEGVAARNSWRKDWQMVLLLCMYELVCLCVRVWFTQVASASKIPRRQLLGYRPPLSNGRRPPARSGIRFYWQKQNCAYPERSAPATWLISFTATHINKSSQLKCGSSENTATLHVEGKNRKGMEERKREP